MHTSLAHNARQPGLPLGPKFKARPVILQEAWPVLLLLYLDEVVEADRQSGSAPAAGLSKAASRRLSMSVYAHSSKVLVCASFYQIG